jgi:hypothetical protein
MWGISTEVPLHLEDKTKYSIKNKRRKSIMNKEKNTPMTPFSEEHNNILETTFNLLELAGFHGTRLAISPGSGELLIILLTEEATLSLVSSAHLQPQPTTDAHVINHCEGLNISRSRTISVQPGELQDFYKSLQNVSS